MKRIFIIQNTPLNEPLPLSVYLTDLLRNFNKNKEFEINLIIGKSKDIPKEIIRLCNKIYQFQSSTYSIKDNLKFSFFIKRILKKENHIKKIDIVHCFYPNSSLLGAVLFKLNNKDVRIIYDVRSPWIEMSIERGFINKWIVPMYKKILYSEEKWLCNKTDEFIFITEGIKNYYTKKYNLANKKIFISPSGVDTNIFKKVKTDIRQKYGIKDNEILIGSVGGIAKIRKLDEFLDIFKEIINKNKKIKLMFVGEGDSLQDLKNKSLNFNKNVIFVGKVPHDEVPEYISAFDFGLCHLPNIFIYQNSFPLKILEYLACGVPVLASELKAHEEISKQLNGIYIYKNKKDLLKILKNKHKISNEDIINFSWNSLTKNYEKMWGK